MTRHASYRREPQDAPIHCGKRMVLRFGPHGAFFGCWVYPGCKAVAPANVTEPDWGWGKARPTQGGK